MNPRSSFVASAATFTLIAVLSTVSHTQLTYLLVLKHKSHTDLAEICKCTQQTLDTKVAAIVSFGAVLGRRHQQRAEQGGTNTAYMPSCLLRKPYTI